MKRIGNALFTAGLFLVLTLTGSSVGWAQSDISVEASVSESTVYTGERVSLSIEISGSFNNVSRPELPDFDNFRLLSNSPSTSRSYRYINGQSSVTYTYSYYLIAQKKGEFKIPPANITIDGEAYTTNAIPVRVVDRDESANSSASEQPDIFLQLEVSDKKPVAGQQIITDVILFFRDGLEVNSYQPVPGWKAEGFWKEELENSGRPRAESTIIDGVRYRKARLLQFSLFPTKSGKLEISPYKIVVAVRSARSNNDPFSSFFSGFGNNQREVELTSDPITLDVQPLSETDNAYYLGAVGDFDISRSISTNNAIVGESIEIETHIRGTGNIPLISKPNYELPDGLEIYEPQESSRINRRNGAISGSKTFTDVIIARSPGNYTIPERTVSYYDPSRDEYQTTTLAALTFTIEENPDAVATATNSGQFPVSPITGLASWVSVTPAPVDLLAIWWFWVGWIIPLLLLGVAYWRKSYIEKMETDTAFARSVKAADKAQNRLDKAVAVSQQGNIKQAYNLLQKAITGFISDRLNMPEAGLSNQAYIEALKDEEVEENLVKNVRMLLDKCASISYAPNTTHAYLKSHVGLAESTLEKLQKVL
ncbi:BatD family protein [Fodinibius sp. Rm-B-1B1-1]|uniref:BatD family protein n=1 Tax=Fodinibius alkaliphilus TaxID=3140241 RepID=UPI00315ACCFC